MQAITVDEVFSKVKDVFESLPLGKKTV